MTAGTLRLLLLLVLFALYALAILYLSRRPLTPIQFAGWGLLALIIPVLGPFIVFLARPGGKPPRSETVRSRHRR
jgi:hypothetical protein